jgi:hypothetical protein
MRCEEAPRGSARRRNTEVYSDLPALLHVAAQRAHQRDQRALVLEREAQRTQDRVEIGIRVTAAVVIIGDDLERGLLIPLPARLPHGRYRPA